MKKICYLFVALLCAMSVSAQEVKTHSVYDVNQNDEVTVEDVTTVVDQVKANVAAAETQQYVTGEVLTSLFSTILDKLKALEDRMRALEAKVGIEGPAAPQQAASFETVTKSLKVGETYTQSVTSTSEGAVSYFSSNPSVATVDASTGQVTAVANGEAVITAVIAASSAYSALAASYTVLVEEANMHNGHEYVDLGVVVNGKTILWAKTNIGAEKPADYGDYYAWGETETKSRYGEKDYKYYQYTEPIEDEDGLLIGGGWHYVDIGNDISGTEYDVAHVKWCGNWRMPSEAELDALRAQCNWTWVQMINSNGETVNGYKVANKQDDKRFIFLPAVGNRDGTILNNSNNGFFWSGSFSSSDSNRACCLTFNSTKYSTSSSYRRWGFPVRPVCQ